jgi:hypothetical protein
MTDFEDTHEVIEGPPTLGAEETGCVGGFVEQSGQPTLLGLTG